MVVVTIALGLPTRVMRDNLPQWYTMYAGDFLWAMLVYFMFCFLLKNLRSKTILIISLLFACTIEFTQLFHPVWLEHLRSIKLCSLVLGHCFLFSDIIAYSLGIILAFIIDLRFVRNQDIT